MKIKILKILVVTVVILSVTVACTNQGTAPEEFNQEVKEDTVKNKEEVDLRSYFLAREGMKYKFAGEGMEFAGFAREIKYVNQPFVQFHDNNGGTTVGWVYKLEDDQIAAVERKEEFYDDSNLLSQVTDETDVEEIILKTPLEEGASWKTNGKVKKIVKVNSKVSVAAGNFYDVIQVEISREGQENNFVSYEYYAKNIGLIMRQSKGEGFEVSSKLKSYGMDFDR